MNSSELLGAVRAGARRALLAAGLFSLGVNLLMLTVPLYMLQIYDRVLMSRSLDTLALLTAIALAALVTLGLLEVVRGFVFVRLGGWLERKLSGYVLAGSLDAALRDGQASVQGLRDLQTVRGFLSGPGMVPLLDAPWTPLFLAVIFLLHPLLGWLALAGALFLLATAISNHLATYVAAAISFPMIFLIVVLEERELRTRFGSDYLDYCRSVPRFVPRLSRPPRGSQPD